MLPRPPIWERGKAGLGEGDRGLGENDSEGILTKNGSSLGRGLDDRDALADHLLSMSAENGTLKIDGIDHRVDVKQEPEESFDNLEFQNVTDNLADNEMMLQNISPEQVLMGESENGIGLTVDPLEGNRFDDNYYFLMSLLPHIRTLPADRRMLLRMQMQELVYKEVYKKGNEDGDTP
ncbi:hypothetical protein KPH14_002011 [Odynerus spinipes]|uniref:BESS domain-containing protein n=1 Tax=Odynerus spinipes TaxID=1348599 RepID=A0AAD9VW52_9HYME|nr:hypothetical protein KPH14_002011 [Odynerus spinipes]